MSFPITSASNAARAAGHAPTGPLSDTARQAVDKATDMGTLNPGRLADDLSRRPAAERQQLLQELTPRLSPRDADSLTQELAARGTPVEAAGAAKPKAGDVDVGELALDLTQIGLDIVGIFDPTPISDGANTLISLGRGDWLGAGLSALSMIPYVGDAAKLGKLGRYAETVAKAVDAAKANPALAEKLAPALKKISDAIDQLPLDKLPDSVRDGLAPIKGKLDDFARIGVREAGAGAGDAAKTAGTAVDATGRAAAGGAALNADGVTKANGIADDLGGATPKADAPEKSDGVMLIKASSAEHYAELINSNRPWSWKNDFPDGDKLTSGQKAEIKREAIEKGLIPDVKFKPETKFPDFESANLINRVDNLPENLWLAGDPAQFNWLDSRIPGGRPHGYTWHHSEIPGRMELVPFGIHNIINHIGGRSPGFWAHARR